jgi:hypothetical protein
MAKTNGKGKEGPAKVPALAFQDGELEFRAEVGQGKFYSCIKIKVRAWQAAGGNRANREIELSLSYYQAEVLAEILQNFVESKRCHRKAQTPVVVKWDGATRWSTYPYSV